MHKNRLKMICIELKKNLASIFYTKIEDKRLKPIIITDVSIDKELSYAKIFFILYKPLSNYKDIDLKIRLLNRANNFLIKKIKNKMYIKRLPKFIYLYDKSIYQADKTINLIKDLKIRQTI